MQLQEGQRMTRALGKEPHLLPTALEDITTLTAAAQNGPYE